MAHTKNGLEIGRASHIAKQEWLASLVPDETPNYAPIVIATFGKDVAREIYMTGFGYFKQVSMLLSRLDEHERETAVIMVGLGNDLDKIMQAIECDRMTREVQETQYSL